MKLLVCGSRKWNDYAQVERCLDAFRKTHEVTEIITGGAHGADSCGAIYAKLHDIKSTIMRADWKTLGRGAGYARNLEMLAIADAVIAFWDGESPGTKHTIASAQTRNLPVTLIVDTSFQQRK